jgi:hypothetical protein
MCVTDDEHKMQQLPAMNEENKHFRDAHADHYQLPGTPDYRGGFCAAVMERRRKGTVLLYCEKKTGVKGSIQLN